MNKLSKKWEFGSYALIYDDHISYYTFFTIVLTACSYVWVYQKIEVAIPLTLIMLGYIANVIITAWLKETAILEIAKFSIVLSILYVVVFILLFVLIFKIDKTFAIAFNVILFVGTGIAMLIRTFQDSIFSSSDEIINAIEETFDNKTFWIISQIILIGVPFIAFTVLFAQITIIPLALRIIIPILYAIIAPFIAALEDDLCACDIFELIFEY